MTTNNLIDFLQGCVKSNPTMSDQPIHEAQGGEIEGIEMHSDIVRLISDFRPEHCSSSKWQYFSAIFSVAGIAVLDFYELQNCYWPEGYMRLRAENPWWLVKTPYGLVKIGWRKRVISISWDFIDVIVTEDQVTKNNRQVHAYTGLKAIEYLQALKAAIDLRARSFVAPDLYTEE